MRLTTTLLTVATITTPLQDAQVVMKTTETQEAWYAQPVWIAVGVIVFVLVVVLIALAGRRNSTTAVK